MNSFEQKYLINFWGNSRAMITPGILSAVYFGIFDGIWAVTEEMTCWGEEFLELLGMGLNGYPYYQKQDLDGTPLTGTDGVVLISTFTGCLVAALLANKVKFRLFANNIRISQAIVGGIPSGYGTRLAFGCNLANFFMGLPYFSLHTWLFGVFMALGIYFGVKPCNTSFFKPKTELQCANKENIPLPKQSSCAKLYFVLGSILFVAFLIWVFHLVLVNGNISIQSKQSLLASALIFGFASGFTISKGQIYFIACSRDLFLFGRENAIEGALIGVIIASLIVFALVLHGHNSKLIEPSPAVAIGTFLFGFGIVFAGGCECGWTYRAREGRSHFTIVGIANIIGTMISALTYDFLPSALKEGVKINLFNKFGNSGGFFINLALFILMFTCVLFYKKHFFQKLNRKG